ncbi:MAG: family metalloprotease protein [Candidatus Eremiobacteraeota bacterium]|nr:family metalloprotease protein [Candidatus Eremiobacteraeota bacterium]
MRQAGLGSCASRIVAPARCAVSPHPDALARLQAYAARRSHGTGSAAPVRELHVPWEFRHLTGRGDGVVRPGDESHVRGYARKQSLFTRPLRALGVSAFTGPRTLNVLVALVNFPDKSFSSGKTAPYFHDLFFSSGRRIPTGSVNEYYVETSRSAVALQGDVVGPYMLPQPSTYYAGGTSGEGAPPQNAQTMAADTLEAMGSQAFKKYDNDGDGFVDAFVIVHAGAAGEYTLEPDDLWSLKWILNGPPQVGSDGTQVFGFLTVSEDSTIGVCAHELGHLLFGLPDLYDTTYRSSGIGRWCLMAGGSWNGTNGNTPAHMSAWCMAKLGWAPVVPIASPSRVVFSPMESGGTITRLDVGTSEYFLIENRQRADFDSDLPGEGLLIFHIDDSRPDNTVPQPKVALIQADGLAELEAGTSRGDAGDPYPGSTGNTTFDAGSVPPLVAYGTGSGTIGVTAISASGSTVSADCSA